jgi:hypothetical protein
MVRRAAVLALWLHVAHAFCPPGVLHAHIPSLQPRRAPEARRSAALHCAAHRASTAPARSATWTMQARSDGMDWGPQVRGLEGKVCLVTGASTGIGQGIATALGEQGAKVRQCCFVNVRPCDCTSPCRR